MPYVEGESLRQHLDRVGQLPLAEAVRLLREIADALIYAHRRMIIHRDLKPANILLEQGHALIIDFGIAKALSAAAEEHSGTGLTSTGLVVGTPTYMAPEQAAGDPLDHRVDLYALGCLAYELLAGRPPFRGRSSQELIAAHLADPPLPVTALRPGTPAVLADLVMRLLAKRREERPESAEEVVRVLGDAHGRGPRGVGAGARPAPGRRPSDCDRPPSGCRRRRGPDRRRCRDLRPTGAAGAG